MLTLIFREVVVFHQSYCSGWLNCTHNTGCKEGIDKFYLWGYCKRLRRCDFIKLYLKGLMPNVMFRHSSTFSMLAAPSQSSVTGIISVRALRRKGNAFFPLRNFTVDQKPMR